MKSLSLALLAMCAVSASASISLDKRSYATYTSTVVAPANAKGWTGSVCTLVGCASGKSSVLSKADAKTSVSRNELLCLCVKNACYIVLNGDGTNASAQLAELAGGDVTVTGKLLKKGGVNVILADSIK